jgi:hypothetical protein
MCAVCGESPQLPAYAGLNSAIITTTTLQAGTLSYTARVGFFGRTNLVEGTNAAILGNSPAEVTGLKFYVASLGHVMAATNLQGVSWVLLGNGTLDLQSQLWQLPVNTATLQGTNILRTDIVTSTVTYTNAAFLMLEMPIPSSNGSYTVTVPNGWSMIANHLDRGSNTLDEVMPNAPNGTECYAWDVALQDLNPSAYTFVTGVGWWPANGKLPPGQPMFLMNPAGPFSLTFTGQVHTPIIPLSLNRSVFYFLSRQTVGTGTFENITGLAPEEGTTVLLWDVATQDYHTNLFTGGQWQPTNPIVAIGQGMGIRLPPGIAPSITSQPQSLTVPAGQPAAFTVAATGTGPLNYQWMFRPQPNNNLPTNIPSATAPSLTISNVQPIDAGGYLVVVAGPYGSVTSQVATLTVAPATNCLHFAGLVHCALGAATLTVHSNLLTLANLGSSGQDGVAISVDGFDGHSLTHSLTELLAAPGASITIQFNSRQAGGAAEPLASVRSVNTGMGLATQVRFDPPGVTGVKMDLYAASGRWLGSADLDNGGQIIEGGNPPHCPPGKVPEAWSESFPDGRVRNHYSGRCVDPFLIAIGTGGVTNIWTNVAFADFKAVGVNFNDLKLLNTRLTTTVISQLDLRAEKVAAQGAVFSGLGNSLLQTGSNSLAVTGISSGGSDGVSILCSTERGLNLFLQVPGGTPDGGWLDTALMGERTDTSEQVVIHRLRETQSGSNVAVSVEFPLVSVTNYQMAIFRNGVLVAQRSVAVGPGGATNLYSYAPPRGGDGAPLPEFRDRHYTVCTPGSYVNVGHGRVLPCIFDAGWQQTMVVSYDGNPIDFCINPVLDPGCFNLIDKVWILAEGPGLLQSSLTNPEVHSTGSQLGSLVLTEASYATAASAVRLNSEVSGGGLRMTWDGGGVLLRADRLDGPWTPLFSAESGTTMPVSGTGGFFRVRVNASLQPW